MLWPGEFADFLSGLCPDSGRLESGRFATVCWLVNWFSRNRAKAVAISQMGYALGGICVPLVIICLEAFGWRTTAFISGVIVLVAGLPMVQLVRTGPEIGEIPDGA